MNIRAMKKRLKKKQAKNYPGHILAWIGGQLCVLVGKTAISIGGLPVFGQNEIIRSSNDGFAILPPLGMLGNCPKRGCNAPGVEQKEVRLGKKYVYVCRICGHVSRSFF